MTRYLFWRIALLALSTLVASVVVFGVLRVLPGDVAIVILGGGGAPHTPEVREALREELGLNDPLAVQYGRWLWSMSNGEFGGQSLVNGQSIRSLVVRQLPVTLLLALYTFLLSLVFFLSLWFFFFFFFFFCFVFVFHWSPPIVYTHPWEDPWNHLQIVIWPVLLLAWEYSSHIVRVTRSSMLKVLHEDFVTLARAKGL